MALRIVTILLPVLCITVSFMWLFTSERINECQEPLRLVRVGRRIRTGCFSTSEN
jgi:hypothetical protein